MPWHLDGPHVWSGIILEGAAEMMLKGYGVGNNIQGYYPLSMQEALPAAWATRINDVSPTVKLVLMLGEYMHRNYHGRYHSKAQNLRVLLRRAYDEALRKFDVLAMPTIPFTATPIPPPDAPLNTVIDVALNMQANTCSFDVSGPSRLHGAMRPRQRFAGRPDAGRAPFRGNDIDPAGSGDRGRRRLEAELDQNENQDEAIIRCRHRICTIPNWLKLDACIQKRDLSAVEATQAQLDRIGRLDGKLKSYAHVMAASALEQARAADKEIADGKMRGPLHGVPIAVKDLCWTKDAPTAAGMKIYRDNRPERRCHRRQASSGRPGRSSSASCN